VALVTKSENQSLSIEHPAGEFTVNLELDFAPSGLVVKRAGLVRTARALFDGFVFAKRPPF